MTAYDPAALLKEAARALRCAPEEVPARAAALMAEVDRLGAELAAVAAGIGELHAYVKKPRGGGRGGGGPPVPG